MENVFYSLASKSNFNKSLRHFYLVSDVVDEIESKNNLADVINDLFDSNEIQADQILPLVGATIKDKYLYNYDSFNVPKTISEFNKICDETSKWTAIDIIIVYYKSNGEIFLINPKNINHWERVRELTRDQLIVVYAKHIKTEPDNSLEKDAIIAVEEMIAGKDVFINKEFIDKTVMPKKVAPKPQPKPQAAAPKEGAVAVPVVKGASHNSTPKYSITVTNELFHNGNVEAWKKIVESFDVSHPDLTVTIYFEGELINDINSLFKWGKVKHGDPILFQISGDNIRDVSKLKKYLHEGASPRFEQFLKIGVGRVLNLF